MMSDGDRNTGDRNTGGRNTGNCNTGDRNTGYRNTGNWNTGDRNTGYRNTGNCNTGYRNTGYRNTGNWNTGNWNTGNWNTGYFCENDGPVMFFDQPCDLSREEAQELIPRVDLPCGVKWVAFGDMSDKEKQENPNSEHVGGYCKEHTLPLKESFPVWWASASNEDRQRFIDLPNFDADKFERMLGVRVGSVSSLEPKAEVVIDGVRYVRAD